MFFRSWRSLWRRAIRCFLTRLYLDLSPFMLDMSSSWWSGWMENKVGTIRCKLHRHAIDASAGLLAFGCRRLELGSGVNCAGPLVQKRRLSISQSRRRKVCRIFGVKQFQYTLLAGVPPDAQIAVAEMRPRRLAGGANWPWRSTFGQPLLCSASFGLGHPTSA